MSGPESRGDVWFNTTAAVTPLRPLGSEKGLPEEFPFGL